MTQYASTFTVGLEEVVREMLLQLFSGARVLLLIDGLIIYEGDISVGAIRNLPFFNNSFIVLEVFESLHGDPIHQMVTLVANDDKLEKKVLSSIDYIKTGTTFRLVASSENQHVNISEKLRNIIENRIAGLKKLRVDRHRPRIEFWFLYRNEGVGFFLLRITRHTAYEQILEKGELKPELSHALCFISEPSPDDIFLDPFCGYGSIPIERARAFPYNIIFAIDRDEDKKKFVRQRLKSLRLDGPFIVKTGDALNLESFEDGFIHKIATDPPWGLFEELEVDAFDFHLMMLQEFHRVLRSGGLLVLLTARKDELESALAELSEKLELLNKYNILVSGKKAAIYKIRKTNGFAI